MAFLDVIRNMFRANPVLTTNRIDGMKLISVGTQEVYPEINAQKAIDLGYEGNAAVNSIVSMSAQKFASIPRYVNSVDGSDLSNNKQVKALTALLNRPNNFQGQDAWLETLNSYKVLLGETFEFLNRGDITDANGMILPDSVIDKMPVLEIFTLPANYMWILPDRNDMFAVMGYRLMANGIKIDFRKGDILHWKNVNLDFDASTRAHLRGLSPLTPGYRSLQGNNAATDATVRMHQSDGAKGIIFQDVKEPFEVTPNQMTEIRSVVNTKINSTDAKGAVATLAGKWGYLDLNSSIDMNLLEARKYAVQELCMLFHFPYQLLDPNSTFSNVEWAQKNWVSNTIIPQSKQFDDELNRVLLKAFQLEGIAIIESDFSQLQELQKDLNALATSLSTSVWLTMNEKRIAMGYEPLDIPSFNEPWLPAGLNSLTDIQNESDMINNIPNA